MADTFGFERGTADDTFDLTKKLFTFLSTKVPGWQLWSNIDGYVLDNKKGYDMVYRSVGTSGRNDIYVRARVAPVEPFLRGDDYYDWDGNGDTGYVILQSYLHFPQGGDAYEGYSEVGKFGPRYIHQSGGNSFRTWRHSPLSVQPAGSAHIVNNFSTSSPSNDSIDTWIEERYKFQRQNSGFVNSSSFVSTFMPHDTDGKRYIYAGETVSGAQDIERYSLQRGGGHYSGSTVSRTLTIHDSVGFNIGFVIWYRERTTKTPYLFIGAPSTTDNGGNSFKKLNLITGSLTNIAVPTWPARIETFMFTSGLNSSSMGGFAGCWDGGNYIYILRGGTSGVSNSMNTPDWGRYDILNDSWRTTQDPFDPTFPELPYEFTFHGDIVFYSKQISGFAYNRLYVYNEAYQGVRVLYYINLDDDNGLPTSADHEWHSAGEVDGSPLQTSNNFWINFLRNGRLNLWPQRTSTNIQGVWESFPQAPGRGYYHAKEIPESGNIKFTVPSPAFFPQGSGSGGDGGNGLMMNYFDGYMCRVRTNLDTSTDYIFIADADKIIIATKSKYEFVGTDRWSFAYAGGFESNYEPEPYGELAEDVKAGFSRKVKLKNVQGTFLPNNRYFIVGTDGNWEWFTHPFEGTKRKMAFSESIKITKVEGDTIIASLKHNYGKGAKVGIDPLPTGVFFSELEKFQATNVVNRLFDDFSGSDDPSEQIYTIAKAEDAINSAGTGAFNKNLPIPAYPFFMSNAEGEGEHIGREVRGRLKDVFAVGKFVSSIEDVETININDKGYYVIDVPDYQSFVAIGPIRDGDE